MTQQSTTASHLAASARVVEKSAAELGAKSDAVSRAFISALKAGKKVVTFGNGGSATQASHLAGELIGRFLKNRTAFPAIALGSDPGSVTCIANDFGYEALFERQVKALVERGDVVVGLTTSGKSENVLRGLRAAREKGAVTIALTGEKGIKSGEVDHLLAVPSDVTSHIQEVHLMLLHTWCAAIDAELGDS
jgi:D-sedoheptulose 7-phosphate isomerase